MSVAAVCVGWCVCVSLYVVVVCGCCVYLMSLLCVFVVVAVDCCWCV